jgi:hypothetical protein
MCHIASLVKGQYLARVIPGYSFIEQGNKRESIRQKSTGSVELRGEHDPTSYLPMWAGASWACIEQGNTMLIVGMGDRNRTKRQRALHTDYTLRGSRAHSPSAPRTRLLSYHR